MRLLLGVSFVRVFLSLKTNSNNLGGWKTQMDSAWEIISGRIWVQAFGFRRA